MPARRQSGTGCRTRPDPGPEPFRRRIPTPGSHPRNRPIPVGDPRCGWQAVFPADRRRTPWVPPKGRETVAGLRGAAVPARTALRSWVIRYDAQRHHAVGGRARKPSALSPALPLAGFRDQSSSLAIRVRYKRLAREELLLNVGNERGQSHTGWPVRNPAGLTPLSLPCPKAAILSVQSASPGRSAKQDVVFLRPHRSRSTPCPSGA